MVESASTLSGFEANTSSRPSGDTSQSSPPPMENGGASRSPGVRSTAAPPATGAFQMCVRVPSFQESQWRNSRRSATRAFTFDSARALSVFSRQAVSAHSGKTSEAKTNQAPSGDQL